MMMKKRTFTREEKLRIIKDAEHKVLYIYDATGVKLKKQVVSGADTPDRYYAGAFEYDDNKELDLIHTEEGVINVTGSTYDYEYFLKDHLGNTRVTFKPDGNSLTLLQKVDYYPFGMVADKTNGESDNKYLYNGKELQDEIDLDWYDYGARFYDPQIGRWHVIDPSAENYYSWTPYNYVANNPILVTDPTGKDWVVSKGQYEHEGKTYEYDHYEWMDNITAKSTLPEGYYYIGANNNDILTHMGVSTQYDTKSDVSAGVGFAGGGDKNVGPVGKGVPGGTISGVNAIITISANVSYNEANVTKNNKAGITFEGVSITANVSERTASSNRDLNPTSGGYLSVSLGGDEYTAILRTPTGQYANARGTTPSTATVQIPAYGFSSTYYLQSATVSIGRLNPGLIFSRPTKITWGLQTASIFRPNN